MPTQNQIQIDNVDSPKSIEFTINGISYHLWQTNDRVQYKLEFGGQTILLHNLDEWVSLTTHGRHAGRELLALAEAFDAGRKSAYHFDDLEAVCRKTAETCLKLLFVDGHAGKFATEHDIECSTPQRLAANVRLQYVARHTIISQKKISRYLRVCERTGLRSLLPTIFSIWPEAKQSTDDSIRPTEASSRIFDLIHTAVLQKYAR